MLHELGFEKGRVLIQRRIFTACHDMLKKSKSCIWASYFFLEYPFGTPYLELSSEIPAQIFNLLVNIDNFFPVFLLINIGTSFHLFKSPFYVCADPYVICADIFLRMRGKFTIICAF